MCGVAFIVEPNREWQCLAAMMVVDTLQGFQELSGQIWAMIG